MLSEKKPTFTPRAVVRSFLVLEDVVYVVIAVIQHLLVITDQKQTI